MAARVRVIILESAQPAWAAGAAVAAGAALVARLTEPASDVAGSSDMAATAATAARETRIDIEDLQVETGVAIGFWFARDRCVMATGEGKCLEH